MIIKAKLEKQLDLIGTKVNLKGNTIGAITEYDSETGLATIKVDDNEAFAWIANKLNANGDMLNTDVACLLLPVIELSN